MTSKINALSTGAGGLATTADASGILEIQTNSTTAMTVSDSQVLSFNNNFGTVAGLPSYQCRAWVNFDGTGTVAILASGNVTSITDVGTGNYTVNLTNEMPDANYTALGTSQQSGAIYIIRTGVTTKTTTACQVLHNSTTAAADGIISFAIFR